MMDHAILQNGKVVLVDLATWADWLETGERLVKQEHYKGFYVSTVFLGLDHSFGEGHPLWFETMVFKDGDFHDLWCKRAETSQEALSYHAEGKDAIDRGEILLP